MNLDPPPLFSVVIPTYRRPAMLERAVLSVLEQTYRDWEIIVSDDEHENGDTWLLLQRLQRQVPRLRISKNELQHGQAGNTNNGLQQARGHWIKILLDDDRLYPHCLDILAKLVNRFPDVACVNCAADRVTQGGTIPF